MPTKHFTVIAYDITSDKKRDKVSKHLLNYGVRANYSVFECMLTEKQLAQVQQYLAKTIEPKTDRVLVYQICKACFLRSTSIGRSSPYPSDTVLTV
jgi:CRISPR-associated protein Cas2